jgi:hypothetical protein
MPLRRVFVPTPFRKHSHCVSSLFWQHHVALVWLDAESLTLDRRLSKFTLVLCRPTVRPNRFGKAVLP